MQQSFTTDKIVGGVPEKSSTDLCDVVSQILAISISDATQSQRIEQSDIKLFALEKQKVDAFVAEWVLPIVKNEAKRSQLTRALGFLPTIPLVKICTHAGGKISLEPCRERFENPDVTALQLRLKTRDFHLRSPVHYQSEERRDSVAAVHLNMTLYALYKALAKKTKDALPMVLRPKYPLPLLIRNKSRIEIVVSLSAPLLVSAKLITANISVPVTE